ncbi:MAG: RNHCP domain-containing protein [Alphaproteobacteria bacterium]
MKKFKKTKENFICDICGEAVIGDGYTNHCPNCLYSKHVDICPGDRTELCRGIMEPVFIEAHSKKELVITHRCINCGIKRKNKIGKYDKKHGIEKLWFSILK